MLCWCCWWVCCVVVAVRACVACVLRVLIIIQDTSTSIGGLSMESYGYLLYITTKLYNAAANLPGKVFIFLILFPYYMLHIHSSFCNIVQQDHLWFTEDLQELETEETNATQKLSTVQRMYHTYPFLLPNYKDK